MTNECVSHSHARWLSFLPIRDMYVCTHVYMYDGSSFPLRLFLFFFSLKIAVRSREFGVVAVGFCVFFCRCFVVFTCQEKKRKKNSLR